MARVVIVGGGITGLAAAHRVHTASAGEIEVTLFEASERLGGKIRTSPFAGLPAVDEGPDAFLARVPGAVDLARELGCDDLVAPATGRAYLWWDGRMHAIPDGLVLGVPANVTRLARSPLLSVGGRLRAAAEPLVPRGHPEPDNLGALIRHRFGREVLERLVDPLLGSVYAGDAMHFSLAAAAPQIATGAARSRSLLLAMRRQRAAAHPPAGPGASPVFLAPRGGMQSLVEALTASLAQVRVLLGEPVTAIEPAGGGRWLVNGVLADTVLLAVPGPAAAAMLAPLSPDASSAMAGIGYASVVMVTLALPDGAANRPLDGSGHLVPKPVQRHLTAASWASSKWAHWRLDGHVVLRASLGRWGDEHAVAFDDDEVLAAVLRDLDEQLGVTAAPTAVRITRWPRSFPQYTPGHLDRIDEIERALATDTPGVAVAGAAYRGIGVPACIRQGNEWADLTMQRLAPSARMN